MFSKESLGIDGISVARRGAFCERTISSGKSHAVCNISEDPGFNDLGLAGAANFTSYLGTPIRVFEKYAVATLCGIDFQERNFSKQQIAQLEGLADLASEIIEFNISATRFDWISKLPNRSSFFNDLMTLRLSFPEKYYAVAAFELLCQDEVQEIARILGTDQLEKLSANVGQILKTLNGRFFKPYHVGVARFAVIFESLSRKENEDCISRLLTDVEDRIDRNVIFIKEDICAGIHTCDNLDETGQEVLRKATAAIFDGRNKAQKIRVFEPDSDRQRRRSYNILTALKAADFNVEFKLVFQPKFHMERGSIYGVEALLRWHSPVLGEINPAEFIPLAEKSLLIGKISEWVLDKAVQTVGNWRDLGLNLTMAINVSANDLENIKFIDNLRQLMTKHDVPASLLHFECTENAALTGLNTGRTLRRIRDLGCQVSIDDFGIGYCNLASLQDLPAQLLKIDRSLVHCICTHQRSHALLKSIIAMGHDLGYLILAEGVESRNVYDALQDMGCDAIQGYFISPPLPHDELLHFMSTFSPPPWMQQRPKA